MPGFRVFLSVSRARTWILATSSRSTVVPGTTLSMSPNTTAPSTLTLVPSITSDKSVMSSFRPTMYVGMILIRSNRGFLLPDPSLRGVKSRDLARMICLNSPKSEGSMLIWCSIRVLDDASRRWIGQGCKWDRRDRGGGKDDPLDRIHLGCGIQHPDRALDSRLDQSCFVICRCLAG